MALDTYAQLWGRVLLRCPSASSLLAKDWIQNVFRQVAERRRWSWLLKYNQFLVPAQYSTGTVTVTRDSASVTGSGTAWTSAMIGRQFRVATTVPIYTIATVPSGTSLTLDSNYGGSTAATQAYRIYQCYFTPPTDFHAFQTVWDPAMNWQLTRHTQQNDLNTWDAQRATTGLGYCIAAFDYDTSTPPRPRYEIWPHQTSEYVYPYLYEARCTDLADSGASLPRYIRGDMLVELALAEAARWPGPSIDKPNPYYNLKLSQMHQARGEQMILEAERQDDEVYEQDLMYQKCAGFPYATPFGDASWLQSHAI